METEQLRAEKASQQLQLELRQAEEGKREKLKAMGYEVFKPFRDCPDCPEMMVLPSGSFEMGSPPDEVGRYSAEGPQHRVSLGSAFALGRAEVTQGQWRALMGGNPSYFSSCGDLCPVEQVSWNDVQEYLQKLNKLTGKRYRLPSEAEWEYAARAGTTTAFNTGNCIHTNDANYDGNYEYNYCHAMTRVFKQRPQPIGSYPPNSFNLVDMHGNVWEWLEDCWHEDYTGAPVDGSAWTTNPCDKRVLRGGSWKVEARALRSAERNWDWAYERGNGQGFRVALTLF